MNSTLLAEKFNKVFKLLSDNDLSGAVDTLESASVKELRYFLNNQFIKKGDKATLLFLLSPVIKTYLES